MNGQVWPHRSQADRHQDKSLIVRETGHPCIYSVPPGARSRITVGASAMGAFHPGLLPPVTNRGWIQFSSNDRLLRLPLGLEPLSGASVLTLRAPGPPLRGPVPAVLLREAYCLPFLLSSPRFRGPAFGAPRTLLASGPAVKGRCFWPPCAPGALSGRILRVAMVGYYPAI